MMHNKSDISVVILSAGFSSRMKKAKFSLMFDKKKTFLEKIIAEYQIFKCKEIIVVMNTEGIALKKQLNLYFPENVIFVLNKYPEKERFYSLQTVLKAINKPNYTFIQNIDNPFVNQETLSILYMKKDVADYIVPTYKDKGGHPIIINKKIIQKIISKKEVDSNLKEFLQNFSKKTIVVNDEKVIENINTMDNYKKLFL